MRPLRIGAYTVTESESPPTLRFRQAGEGSWGLWRGAETLFTLLVTRGAAPRRQAGVSQWDFPAARPPPPPPPPVRIAREGLCVCAGDEGEGPTRPPRGEWQQW